MRSFLIEIICLMTKIFYIGNIFLFVMKKPLYAYGIAIIFLMLTVTPIGATKLGWYLYDKQTGFNFGMIVGAIPVIYAAWLMCEKEWR